MKCPQSIAALVWLKIQADDPEMTVGELGRMIHEYGRQEFNRGVGSATGTHLADLVSLAALLQLPIAAFAEASLIGKIKLIVDAIIELKKREE